MVYTYVRGAYASRLGGSSPPLRTIIQLKDFLPAKQRASVAEARQKNPKTDV